MALVTGTFGGTLDFDPTERVDVHTASDLGASDLFISAFDLDGDYRWTLAFGATGYSESIAGFVVDPTGNFVGAGAFIGTVDLDPTAGIDERTTVGHTNAFLMRISTNGKYLGTTVFGTGTGEFGVGQIARDRGGNIFIPGKLRGTADLDPGPSEDLRTAEFDTTLTRFNADGSYAWTRTFGNVLFGGMFVLQVDSFGNVYGFGEFRGTVDFDPGPGQDLHTALVPGAPFVTKFTPDGEHVWTRTLDRMRTDSPWKGMAVDPRGNVVITDAFSGTLDFDPTVDVEDWHTAGPMGSAYLTKFSPDGDYLWTLQIDSEDGLVSGEDVTFTPFGQIAWTGRFSGTADFDPGPGTVFRSSTTPLEWDGFVTVLTGDGSHVWTRVFGGPGHDEGRVVSPGPNGSLLLIGSYFGEADLDPGCAEDIHTAVPPGATNVFVMSLGCVSPSADYNRDRVVDLLDDSQLRDCLLGPAPTTCQRECYPFDFDGDDDFDLRDFGAFQTRLGCPTDLAPYER